MTKSGDNFLEEAYRLSEADPAALTDAHLAALRVHHREAADVSAHLRAQARAKRDAEQCEINERAAEAQRGKAPQQPRATHESGLVSYLANASDAELDALDRAGWAKLFGERFPGAVARTYMVAWLMKSIDKRDAERKEQFAMLEARCARLEQRCADAEANIAKAAAGGLRYRGIWQTGDSYETGDVVTWNGGMWACLQPTSMVKPGSSITEGGPRTWQLCVKGGKDGKDAR